MRACSLTLKGPGLKLNDFPPSHLGKVQVLMGAIAAANRPNGYTTILKDEHVHSQSRESLGRGTHSTIRAVILGDGNRNMKKVLRALQTVTKRIPRMNARSVRAVMSVTLTTGFC